MSGPIPIDFLSEDSAITQWLRADRSRADPEYDELSTGEQIIANYQEKCRRQPHKTDWARPEAALTAEKSLRALDADLGLLKDLATAANRMERFTIPGRTTGACTRRDALDGAHAAFQQAMKPLTLGIHKLGNHANELLTLAELKDIDARRVAGYRAHTENPSLLAFDGFEVRAKRLIANDPEKLRERFGKVRADCKQINDAITQVHAVMEQDILYGSDRPEAREAAEAAHAVALEILPVLRAQAGVAQKAMDGLRPSLLDDKVVFANIQRHSATVPDPDANVVTVDFRRKGGGRGD
jgi:hypothetical protein